MNLSKSILGHDIHDLTLRHITDFFQETHEESDIFELKSFNQRNNNYKDKESAILKTICGFLNSSGGLLIWGAPMGTKIKDSQEKVFRGELSPVEKRLEKDAFISKIANNIILTPPSIKFKRIEAGTNKYIYIFETQESITKPHQFKNQYYMRLDGQTVNAPHHYVEALFKQIRYPNLEGYITFNQIVRVDDYYLLNIYMYIFNTSPLQNEEKPFFKLLFQDAIIKEQNHPDLKYSYNQRQAEWEAFSEVFHFGNQLRMDFTVKIFETDLLNKNNVLRVNLSFGGKYSPMKMSAYKITFPEKVINNIEDIEIQSIENKLRSEAMLIDERNRINILLGRS